MTSPLGFADTETVAWDETTPPCELDVAVGKGPCPMSAAFIMRLACPACGYVADQVLMCDGHAHYATSGGTFYDETCGQSAAPKILALVELR
jgi:hypothetical protein